MLLHIVPCPTSGHGLVSNGKPVCSTCIAAMNVPSAPGSSAAPANALSTQCAMKNPLMPRRR